MLVETIKDYTDKETKQIFRTTDNCTIRRVSDARGKVLIAGGVVKEVKLEDDVKTDESVKSKQKSKKKDDVKTDVETLETEQTTEDAMDNIEESIEDTQSE